MPTTTTPVVRFRHHQGLAVAGAIVAISTSALLAVSPALALLVLVPVGFTIWVWRAGTDADRAGLRVRALLGTRRLPWSEVRTLRPDHKGRVVATLATGGEVPLTAVTVADLPRLVAASGHQIDSDPA